uniref:Uncharacterized protein n=1 Tax=Rhizophora mucronata TaxID=61149 RepID=A0A2P2IL11_RHIMU
MQFSLLPFGNLELGTVTWEELSSSICYTSQLILKGSEQI